MRLKLKGSLASGVSPVPSALLWRRRCAPPPGHGPQWQIQTPWRSSPLDPLIHDRKRLEALYNFRYRWEIYTPERKREYGPYTLPIHAGDRLVGRIQLRRHKGDTRGAGAALVIDGLWWERGAKPRNHLDGLSRAIRSHQRLLGLSAGRMPREIAERSDGKGLFNKLKRSDLADRRAAVVVEATDEPVR